MSITLTIDGKKIEAAKARPFSKRRWMPACTSPTSATIPICRPWPPAGSAWLRSRACAACRSPAPPEAKDGMVVTHPRRGAPVPAPAAHVVDPVRAAQGPAREDPAPQGGGVRGASRRSSPTSPIPGRQLPILADEPLFERDLNLCILCGRCVAMCQDVRQVGVLNYSDRGYKSMVSTAFGETLFPIPSASSAAPASRSVPPAP